MTRYIDADKALEDFDEWVDATGALGKGTSYYYEARSCIEDVPTADVVEVVRCKDCLYCEDFGMSGLFCNHPDDRNPVGCRPGDFCSDGRKRKKVQNDRETEKNSIAE